MLISNGDKLTNYSPFFAFITNCNYFPKLGTQITWKERIENESITIIGTKNLRQEPQSKDLQLMNTTIRSKLQYCKDQSGSYWQYQLLLTDP